MFAACLKFFQMILVLERPTTRFLRLRVSDKGTKARAHRPCSQIQISLPLKLEQRLYVNRVDQTLRSWVWKSIAQRRPPSALMLAKFFAYKKWPISKASSSFHFCLAPWPVFFLSNPLQILLGLSKLIHTPRVEGLER